LSVEARFQSGLALTARGMNHLYYQAEQGSSQDSYDAPATPLEVNVESRSKSNDATPPTLRAVRVIGSLVALLAFVMLVINNGGAVGRTTGYTSSKALEETTDSDFSISVEVTSPGYDEVAQSLEFLPWDAVAEVHRTQYISVSEFIVDSETLSVSDDSYDVSWSIDGSTYTGTDVEFQIDTTGVYDCTVSITPKTSRRRLGDKKSKSDKKSDSSETKETKSDKSKEKRFSAYHESRASKAASTSTMLAAGVGMGVSVLPSLDTTELETTEATTTSEADTSASTTTTSTDSTSRGSKRGSLSGSTVLPGMSTTSSSSSATVVSTTTTTGVSGTSLLTDSTATTTTTSASASDVSSSPMGSVEAGMSYTLSFTLAVKYVRRELRALSDDDKANIINALYLMYTVDEVPGKATYGDKFNTAEYYSYKHLNGAGTTDCDHWHDGAGIVTHHMAFTLEVEQTLQAIDPSVAMPYWEYGMDPYLYTNWWESPMFDSDMFGEANPSNDDHIISDGGYWDGITVPDGDDYLTWSIPDTGTLNPFINGYTKMRSPWNNNPSPYIGRHNQTYSMSQYDTMPLCSTLQSCFKSTSFAYISDCLNGATHGPVHILIGGAWGEGSLFDDEDIEFARMPDKLLFFKVLWRMGYTRCPETCTLGAPCKCAVPQEYIDTYGAETLLTNTNIIYGLASDLVDADDELYLKVLRAVEDPGIAGEMFSSAAAFDPSFWPLHGAAERLVDLKRIYIAQGDITTFDETWAYVTYNKASGAAYLNGVCDWSKVAGSGDLTLPSCTLDVTCDGHNENDVLEFAGFLNEGESYTNIEFYDFMHPWSDDLPYTYDTFDYDYCDEQVRWAFSVVLSSFSLARERPPI